MGFPGNRNKKADNAKDVIYSIKNDAEADVGEIFMSRNTGQLSYKVYSNDVRIISTGIIIGGGTTILSVANYAALPPANTVPNQLYHTISSQGTWWLPWTLGGTYYPSGLYYSDGIVWSTTAMPSQATQAEVNAGVINDKFVSPLTLINYPGVIGPQGPIGPTGPQGVIGNTGLTGSTGLTGANGIDGIQGIQGTQGIIGLTGADGVIGLTGAQGIQGAIGNTGNDGATGPTGLTGSQGIQGLIGADGIQGIQGNTGLTGNTGPQGIQGIIGADGPQGIQGLIGLTGPSIWGGITGLISSQIDLQLELNAKSALKALKITSRRR